MKALGLLLFLLVVGVLVGCTAHGKLPAAPASAVPLVEYSDDGETWKGIVKNDVVYLSASTVKVRKTKEGAAFIITVTDDLGASSSFKGSVTKEEENLVIEGTGTLIIKYDADPYAKIILE